MAAGPKSPLSAILLMCLLIKMVKNPPAIQETRVQSLEKGRPPGEGNGDPLLPGESHEQRSLMGYSPWGGQESDTIERLTLSLSLPSVCECHLLLLPPPPSRPSRPGNTSSAL